MSTNSSEFKPAGNNDKLAHNEDAFFSSRRDLENEAQENQHDRFENFRASVNCIAIWLLYFFALLFVAGLISVAWHLMAPEYLHYLSSLQQDRLHTIVSSALFSSIATNYIKNRVQ